MAVQYDSEKGLVTWLDLLKKQVPEISSEVKELLDFFNDDDLLKLSNSELRDFFDGLNGADEDFLKFIDTIDSSKNVFDQYQQWLTKNGKSTSTFADYTKKAGSVLKSFGAALGSMFVNWAIGKVIDLAVTGIDNLVHSAEHCKERIDELMSSYQSALDEANNNAKTVEDLASRYETLSKGVNNLGQNIALTTDEYTEYNDIANQIADMFPDLIQGYTDEGTAILSLKGNVEQLRDAYKEAQQEAYNMLVISGKDSDGNNILKNTNTVLNGDTFNESKLEQVRFIGEIEAASQSTEQLAALWDSMSERSYKYTRWFNEFTGIYGKLTIKDLSADDLYELRNELEYAKKKYQLEIDESVSNTQTLLEAYLKTDEDYGGLDDEAKRIASILINSIDAEIASGFKKDPIAINDYVIKILDAVQNPKIHDSLSDLFTLDTAELSVSEAKEKIDKYIHDIASVLEEDEYQLRIRLGFENIYETYYHLQNAIRILTDDHGITDRTKYQKLFELLEEEGIELSELTLEQADLFITTARESNNVIEFVRKYKDALAAAKEASASTPLTITQTVDQINTRLKSAFSSLQSAYQEIFTLDEDTGEKIFASLDEVDITDKFQPILDALQALDELDGINVDYSSYENFVSVLSDTSSTAEEVQEQFDRLATDIIYTSDCTNMSAETFNLLAESLSEMGITNAYEMLGKIRDAQEELDDAGHDVANITAAEARELINLGTLSVETAEYLKYYLTQKELAQNPLSTLEDIIQLEDLYNALGVTGQLYEYVIDLKRAFAAKESGAISAGLDESIESIQAKIKELARGYGYENFKFNFDKSGTSSSKSGSSSAKDTTETFNWIEQAIENVEKEIKDLDEVANSSYSTFSEKNEAFAQEIRKVSDEIDLQQQAYAEYMRRANSVGLPEQYKQLVQSGAINIEDIADENLQDMIGEYQKWYDKAQDVSDAIKDLKTDMKDLYVSVYELQTNNLKDRLDSDSITQKQYLDGLKDAYEQFYADLEDFAEQYHEAVLEYLSEEKDYLNSVAGAASSLLDTEIDKIQDDAQLQADSIQRQIDLLEAKKKPLQDELDALDDKAKREELILNFQKAQYELARSENQRTKLVYQNGQMVYTSDSEAIRDAQKGVDDAKLEIQKQSIQDQIDALDDEINRYNDLIDQINNAADAQIDALEKIKNKWQEVIDQQEYAKNLTLLTSEFGESAITKILTGNDDDLLAQWKDNYISTLAGIDMESQGYIGDMTQQIASLYNVDLSPLQSQFQNVTTSIGGVTDALGKATSAVGNGISAPAYEQNTENESASNGSLSDSIKNLGSVSNETLPNVTSNMGAIEETAMSAASEVSNVAEAIDNIPESKDVTINIHTVGGNVSGGISSKVSQIAYTGNAYADGTRRAEKGLAVVGEEKPEVVITNDKKALLAEQPTLINMEGGETVFDGDETAKMLKAKGLRPVTSDEFPLLKAFSQFTPEEIRQKFSLGHVNPARTISSSIAQNASNVNNSSVNHASCTVGNIHIHCPGITKDEVAKQIGTEVTNMFSGLSLKAYQQVNITR